MIFDVVAGCVGLLRVCVFCVYCVVLLVYLLEGFRWCRSGSVCFDCLFVCACVSGYDVWWLGWAFLVLGFYLMILF